MKKLITYLILITSSLLCFTGVKASDSNYIYLNNVDDPATVEEIQQELSVEDDFDGDLTSDIYVVVDNYTGHEQELGAFVIVFGVTDSGGREETIAITVQNVDVTAPVFYVDGESEGNLPNQIIYFVGKGTDINLKMPDVASVDSIDGDVTDSIVISDFENVNTDVAGNYIVHYVAIDNSGNTSSLDITISVVYDYAAPVFYVDGEITTTYNHYLDQGRNINLSMPEILVLDEVDGDLTDNVIITGLNTVDTDTIGNYVVEYIVSDYSGNISALYITVSVVEPVVAPIIPVSDFFPFLGLSLTSWGLISTIAVIIGWKVFGKK